MSQPHIPRLELPAPKAAVKKVGGPVRRQHGQNARASSSDDSSGGDDSDFH
jgi:hypothetical protein